MELMHVVIFSHSYPPFTFGGIGSFISDLAMELSNQGVQVTVISGRPRINAVPNGFKLGEVKAVDNANLKIIRLGFLNVPPRHLIFQLSNLKKIRKIIKDVKPDVIHGQSGSTFPSIRYFKDLAPVVVTFHLNPKTQQLLSLYSMTRGGSFGDFFTFFLGYPLWNISLRKEFEESDAAVFPSKTSMEELTSYWRGGVNDDFLDKCVTIYNGVNLERLDEFSSGCREEEEPTLVFGGRLYWSKGVLYLLRLAKILKEKSEYKWKISIFGSGPMLTKLKRTALKYDLTNVRLHGKVDRRVFIQSLSKSDFLVFPSFNELCPMVLLEAMCLGVIPLLLNTAFAYELTENGKFGVISSNVEEMAEKLDAMYSDGSFRSLKKELKTYAREKFDIKKVASNYVRLYDRLI